MTSPSMYTQCPTCRTLFRVTAAQLQAAEGKVRCGACHAVFHAPSHLHHTLHEPAVEAKPPAAQRPAVATPQPAESAPARGQEAQPSTKQTDDETYSIDLNQLFGTNDGTGTDASPAGDVAGDSARSDMYEEVPATASLPPSLSPLSVMLAAEQAPPPRTSLLGRSLWLLGILLLLAALGTQYLHMNRTALAGHANLRPLLETMCTHLGCQLPPRRDLSAFFLLERDIRSHPQNREALIISAVFQNRARFAQPYPAMEVVMHDVGGKMVAARRFQPQDYLPEGAEELVAPQATVELELEVLDPGPEAVGFEFTFH